MSYQTVSDIFAGSQNNYDFQKKEVNGSFGGTSSLGGTYGSGSGSASFGELVSFYKNENNSNNNLISQSRAESERAEKAAVAEDKARADAEAKAVERSGSDDNVNKAAAEKNAESEAKVQTQADENAEKNVDQADDFDDKDRVKSEEGKAPDDENNSVSESKNKNNSGAAELGLVVESEGKGAGDKKAGGKGSKDGKISKLTNKDFARMDQISGGRGDVAGNGEVSSEKSVNNKKIIDKKALNVAGKGEDKVSDEKLTADELSEKLQKEAALEDAGKNAGADAQAKVLAGNAGKSNGDDSEELNLSGTDVDDLGLSDIADSNAKSQVFMDKDKKISVQDFRTAVAEAGEAAGEEGADNNAKFKVSEPKLINDNTANITMEMRQNVNANVMSSNGQTAAANGSNFQAMLNNQIQQSAPEFVKAGNLVLKDNNQGTINLLLRPDELGNVKLHLSLDGKNISGHITVATKEAMEVFKNNAETLREAFIKSGFESASFDVAYSGNNGAGQESAFQQQNDGKEFVARKVYENHSDNSDGEFDKIVEKNDKNKEYSINIVA